MPVEFDAEIAINEVTLQADADISTPGTGDTSYLSLTEKPQINGVTLVGNLLTEDLNIDHVLVADNLSSHDGTTSTSPYTLRSAPSYAGSVAELRKIVGGTLGWNQIIADSGSTGTNGGFTFTKNGDGSWTITGTGSSDNAFRNINYSSGANNMKLVAGHVYFLTKGTTASGVGLRMYNGSSDYYSSVDNDRVIKIETVGTQSYTRLQVSNKNGVDIGTVTVKPNCFDLTDMLGSTIADYIYTLESGTTGAGKAFFRSLFPADYYAYSATTLQSVNTSARKVLDSNGNTVRTYPLDSDLTLRGIPKISNGNLYYDGDIYLPSGEVTRKYGEVDLGDLEWNYNSKYFTATLTGIKSAANWNTTGNLVCAKYTASYGNAIDGETVDKAVACVPTANKVWIRDTAYSDATTFTNAMDGVKLVYELATPTTETADPYTKVQLVDNQGSEQFVTTNNTPVGNETFYPEDLTGIVQDLAPLPTTAGTYKLQVTVSGGVPSYAWVSG